MENVEDDADEEDRQEEEGEISTFLKSKNACFLGHRIRDLPEGMKKKKKKTRLPMNAADMQWKFSQDHLAADNYNMRPLGPSPYNPFWSGMQPSMEGYVAPYGGSHLEHKGFMNLCFCGFDESDNSFMLPDLTELMEDSDEENSKEGLTCSGEDEMDYGLADLDVLRELSECSVNQNNIEGLTSLDVDGMDYSLGIVDDWQELSGVRSSFLTNQTTNDNVIPLVAGDAGQGIRV